MSTTLHSFMDIFETTIEDGDTFADRTVLHPPCQHGLSSDGQRAKQRES